MSPAPSTTSPLKPSPFLDQLVAFLLPYWAGFTKEYDVARADVEETIASYGAHTRGGLLNAVQIIANSFAALEMLAQAKIQEQQLSPTMRLRYHSCANSLSRSCQYAEKALDKRLACDAPGAPQKAAEPRKDVSDEEAAKVLRRTQAAIDACRNRLANAQPTILPNGELNFPPDRSQRRSVSAMMQALSAGGQPKGSVAATTVAAASGPDPGGGSRGGPGGVAIPAEIH